MNIKKLNEELDKILNEEKDIYWEQSIDDQKQKCKTWAENNGYTCEFEYEIGDGNNTIKTFDNYRDANQYFKDLTVKFPDNYFDLVCQVNGYKDEQEISLDNIVVAYYN